MIGQIQTTSEAGKWISSICRENQINNIVEIGTWNGMGSTKCVFDAIENTNKKLFSLEINKEMHETAKLFYKDKSEVELILGKITDELIDLNYLNEKFFSDYSFEVKNSWREQDKINLSNCQNVLNQLPEKIDFLILDGGEFTSFHEFNLLKNQSSIIFLDDVNQPCIKNYLVREELLKTAKLIHENLNDRNGYSIFKYER
jgi:CRISPR/Cas system-associated exonuclease Cas4 (RecB family)